MTAIIRVVDIETTGLPDKPDRFGPHKICELGWTDLRQIDDVWVAGLPHSTLINPGRPIPPETSAVHHIIDADVADAPTLQDFLPGFLDFEVTAYAAHNARFEQQFLGKELQPWICTWKNAIRLAPKAPGHGNQTLRYWLNLQLARDVAQPPHRAGPDAYVTAHLLARELQKQTPQEMLKIQIEDAILPYLTFGKHAKEPCEDVPASYWRWVLDNITDNPDVRATANHHLNRMKKERQS